MGPTGCPETPVRNYHFTVRSNPEVLTYFDAEAWIQGS